MCNYLETKGSSSMSGITTKKLVFLIVFLSAYTPLASAGQWNPTPLVIDATDVVEYSFGGSDIYIPFTISGKPAMIWLVIQTKLADNQKPVLSYTS